MNLTQVITFFFLITPALIFSQDENIKYENHTYLDGIRTVQFHVNGDPLGMPILPLSTDAQFKLSFDDMSSEVKDYTYNIIHCDQNWQPSGLTELEYIDGYMDEPVDEYEFSFKTLQEYTHYELLFPNEDIKWTISGNYLMLVYEDDEEGKRLALTRRFMVVDYDFQLKIELRQVSAAKVDKLRTHDEFDFVINHENTPIRNPERTINAVVLQNQRWDNAIFEIPPTYSRNNSIIFDYQDKVVFPAGNEFRYFDMRTLRTRSLQIRDILYFPDHYEVILEKDRKRGSLAYLFSQDANGGYFIDNYDQHNGHLSSDYPDVFFTLYSPAVYQGNDVYVVGAFNDWSLKNKMVYNDAINSYVAKIPLKQGYHNYAYALLPHEKEENEKQILDLSTIEGDSDETRNEYTFLIYYRPSGASYDQLIGSLIFETF